jgi:hypothetical protein
MNDQTSKKNNSKRDDHAEATNPTKSAATPGHHRAGFRGEGERRRAVIARA